MITEEHSKECLSRAYLYAVVGMAGHNISFQDEAGGHDYGVDATIKEVSIYRRKRQENGFKFDLQLKASVDWRAENGTIKYELDADAFNNCIRRQSQSRALPLLFGLLCLPRDSGQWCSLSPETMILRRCCYWFTVSGSTTKNKATVTVDVPETQQLSPTAIKDLLRRIREGESP